MNKKSLLPVMLLCALFAGCANPPIRPFATTFPCPPAGGVCVVPVKVVNGKVEIADEIHVPKQANAINIFWELEPGYLFNLDLLDGITFKPATPPHGQFTSPQVSMQDRRYKLQNKATVYQSWSYSIQFHDSYGKEYFKDPTIINDP